MSKKLFGKFFIFLLVVGLLFAVAPTGQAQAATLCVNPGGTDGCYSTINAALTAAAATGDTITVAAGTYSENLVITKSVVLQGAGRDVTTITAATPTVEAITVTAANVTISGFKVTGTTGVTTDGIWLYPAASGCTIKDNDISGNSQNGMSIESTANTITGNIFTGNSTNSTAGAGVALFNGGNTVQFNTFTGNAGYGGIGSVATTANNIANNWWGSATGPTHVSNPGGTGDPLWTNKAIALLTYSPWLANPPVHNVTQGTNFATIQAAITAASAGDTITVADGTYTMASEGYVPSTDTLKGMIEVKKPITIIAAADGNSTRPVIDATSTTSETPSVFKLRPSNFVGGVLRIEGFEIKGNEATGTAMIGDFCGADDGYTSLEPGKVVINNNVFTGTMGGINFWGNTACADGKAPRLENFEITNNQFTGLVAAGGYPGYGILLERLSTWAEAKNAFAGVVSGNTFTNIASGGTGANQQGVAILVNMPQDPVEVGSSNVSIQNNTVGTGVAAGVGVFTADASAAKVEINKFVNGGIGVSNAAAAGSLDASPNWWGQATGPAAGQVVGNTTSYIPWCGDAACTEFAGPVTNLTQHTGYATIQAAITAANAGDVIEVGAGTYTENLIITTPLTLQSTNWVAKIVGTIGIRASNVTLQGLDISNPGSVAGINLSNDQVTPRLTLSNISILNNKIHDVGGYAGGNTKAIKAAHGPDFVTIEGNQFYNITNTVLASGRHSDAISFGDTAATDPSVGVVIRNNTFANITSAQNGANAISFNNDAGVTAVIEGNTFEIDTISGAYGTAIGLSRVVPGTEIRNNTFQVTNPANVSPTTVVINFEAGTAASASTVVIEKNKFLPDGNMVFNASPSAAVDASVNWWGQDTGPTAEQILYGAVGYLPYCLNPECTQLSQAKLSMTPATINALTCGPQYVDVMVTDVADLTAYTMEVTFDRTKVRIDSVENGTFFTENSKHTVVLVPGDLGNTTGRLVFGAYLQAKGADGDPGPVSGSGSLIRIYFTPLLGSTTFAVADESLLVGWPEPFPMPFSATGAIATLTGGLVKNVSTSVNYCSLASAVAGASTTTNEILQLLADQPIPAMITVDKALTLDLNGKVATASTGINALNVTTGGALNITDSGTTGKITGGTRAVMVNGGGSLTLTNGWLDGTGFDGVFVYGEGSSVTVNGGKITGLYYGISGNGSAAPSEYYGSTNILITGGTVQGGETAIFHPELGLLKITGGTITGGSYNGIEMKAGDLEITGGTIETSAAYVATPAQTGNGNTESGDAILIYNRAGYQGTMTVKITGGTVTSSNGYALREYTYLGEASRTTLIDISGGSFTGGTGTGDAGAAVTFMTTDPAILKLTDGQYNTDPGLPVADFVYTPYDTYISGSWFMIDPVDITATTLAGAYTAGVPRTVTITVADTDHTGPFEVVFTYPAGTSIAYGGTTYICGATCPVIVVTLSDPGPTTLSFGVTLPGAGTYTVGVALNHNAGTGDIRLLDSDTATGVVVSGDFTITGDFSMQGRVARSGIPVTLTWGGTLGAYGPSANTTEVIGNNFTLTVTYGGTYTITTNQPRYLNVITATGKTIMVDGNEVLPALRLRGGNARWMNVDGTPDDIINGGDASIVGTQYGTAGWGVGYNLLNHGDCNFDGKVNIQDLALVGGNYDLTSTTAYALWP